MRDLKEIDNQIENLLELVHSDEILDLNTKLNLLNKLDSLHREYIEKFIEEEYDEQEIFDKNGMFIR